MTHILYVLSCLLVVIGSLMTMSITKDKLRKFSQYGWFVMNLGLLLGTIRLLIIGGIVSYIFAFLMIVTILFNFSMILSIKRRNDDAKLSKREKFLKGIVNYIE